MNTIRVSRVLYVVAALLVVVTAGVNGFHIVQASGGGGTGPYDRFDRATPGESVVAGERTGATVFTAYGRGSGGHLIAVHPNGTLWRHVDDHDEYYDVDPIKKTRSTVVVAAMDELTAEQCPAAAACTRETILKVNLTTGEQSAVYTRYRPGDSENEWHDVDRHGPDRYLIADMDTNDVFEVNTTTGTRTWTWNAQSHYDIGTGGSNAFAVDAYPHDWTHLNDVTPLDDGRVMVSMRNHDQVIFLNRTTGVDVNWTLGADNRFQTLYEPHQPDYLPAERGGPAVVVADSQNDRLVEYQRVDGDWERTWGWSDDRLAWPRDADRLPSGTTLVADSNGNRVFEVGPDGAIVWRVNGPTPGVYEVERLGTGDESAGGKSAVRLGLSSTAAPAANPDEMDGGAQRNVLWNALRYVTPWWFGVYDGLALVLATGLVGTGVVARYGGPRRTLASVRTRLCDWLC